MQITPNNSSVISVANTVPEFTHLVGVGRATSQIGEFAPLGPQSTCQ